MAAISISGLNIANPVISRTFAIGVEHVQWVSTIYLLVLCSTMLLLGRIGDRIGGHKVYLTGLIIFVAGSLCCGLSGSFELLLLSRVLQAAGGAMMMATGIGILTVSFPLEQRGMAMGISVLMVGLGNMCGPSLGGLLLSNFDWKIIFYINIPFGILSFLLGLRFLRAPVSKEAPTDKLDIRGALLLAICVSALILCLSGGFEGSQWFGLLSLVLLPIFFLAEKRHPSPLWSFDLMRNQRFSLGNLVTFLSYFANMMVNFLLPFFMEEVWTFPVDKTGLFIMVGPICMAVSAPLAGVVSDKIGALKMMPAALVIFIAGLASIFFWTEEPVYPLLIGSLALVGLGMGILNTPNNSEIMTAAGKQNAGYAGGFVSTNRNLAFCLGTATTAGVFSMLTRQFEVDNSHTMAYVFSMHGIIIIALVITVISLVICLWLKHAHDKEAK
jgi:EmrB/QacA subfamily drug resistance transporter